MGTPHETHHIIFRSRRAFRNNVNNTLLTVDLKNAFNTIERAFIARAIRQCPKLQPLIGIFLFAYSLPSRLLLRGLEPISSSRGVRQGDPLGPLYFALGIQGILSDLAAEFKNSVHVWAYLDDITLVGPPGAVPNAFDSLRTSLEMLGLTINQSKCRLSTHDEKQLQTFQECELKHVPEGQKILRAFVSNDPDQEAQWVLTQAPKFRSFLDRLHHLPKQAALTLFRYCGAVRWNHIVQSHELESTLEANRQIDAVIMIFAEELLGGCGALENNKTFTGDLIGSILFGENAEQLYSDTFHAVYSSDSHFGGRVQSSNRDTP